MRLVVWVFLNQLQMKVGVMLNRSGLTGVAFPVKLAGCYHHKVQLKGEAFKPVANLSDLQVAGTVPAGSAGQHTLEIIDNGNFDPCLTFSRRSLEAIAAMSLPRVWPR